MFVWCHVISTNDSANMEIIKIIHFPFTLLQGSVSGGSAPIRTQPHCQVHQHYLAQRAEACVIHAPGHWGACGRFWEHLGWSYICHHVNENKKCYGIISILQLKTNHDVYEARLKAAGRYTSAVSRSYAACSAQRDCLGDRWSSTVTSLNGGSTCCFIGYLAAWGSSNDRRTSRMRRKKSLVLSSKTCWRVSIFNGKNVYPLYFVLAKSCHEHNVILVFF